MEGRKPLRMTYKLHPLFRQNLSASTFTEHARQDGDISTRTPGSFITSDDYIYIIGMNMGGPGNVAGLINGVDITTVPWDSFTLPNSGSVPQLTSYPLSRYESFNPLISEVQQFAINSTFTANAGVTANAPAISVPGVTDGLTLVSDNSARLFRAPASSFSNVPEPSSSLMAVLSVGLLSFRRKR